MGEQKPKSRRLKKIALFTGVGLIAIAGTAFAYNAIDSRYAPVPKVVQAAESYAENRPNFLVIIVDDLGFSDLGAFGGEIETPHLDALALGGVRLTGFHTAPTCSPTRAQLLTGTDNHLNGLGRMAEAPSLQQIGRRGYEGALRADVATLPEILLANGYRTVHSGKWHLGTKLKQDPSRRGFQHSFTLAEAGHNHFGVISKGLFVKTTYRENGQAVKSLPQDFYSSDYFTDKLIENLEGSRKADGDKPFFAYLAYTAPHWPLHAPEASIAKYRGKYNAGYDALREARLKRQVELGLAPQGVKRAANPRVKAWDSLSAEDKQHYIATQEVYAGMVDRVDVNVGRLVQYLKDSGQYDNTVILFLSDNGAEGLDLRTADIPILSGLVKKSDNRLGNIGKSTSLTSVGAGWAEAGSAPSRLYKGYQSEGGTRVAAFVTYGGQDRELTQKGGISPVFGTVRDVTPTFLELAGIRPHDGNWQGRKVVPIDGQSWADVWFGQAPRVHPENAAVGAELFGSKSIRKGDWKLLSLRGEAWALYNLADDPGETTDLSAQHPEKTAELVRDWEIYARSNNVRLPKKAVYTP
ncbi:MAG: arylsulfatase [Asticcacaulis sp.]